MNSSTNYFSYKFGYNSAFNKNLQQIQNNYLKGENFIPKDKLINKFFIDGKQNNQQNYSIRDYLHKDSNNYISNRDDYNLKYNIQHLYNINNYSLENDSDNYFLLNKENKDLSQETLSKQNNTQNIKTLPNERKYDEINYSNFNTCNFNKSMYQSYPGQEFQSEYYKNYENSFNPNARFFVMKSDNEDNIYKSIKYRVWCSSLSGNIKLNQAFVDAKNKYPIYLIFSVNKSGRFVGICQMISEVNYNSTFINWDDSNEQYRGFFFVVWISIKDIPNNIFINIPNKYNQYKSVVYSRNNQEVDHMTGFEILKIFKNYPLNSSILDDLIFYEMKDEKIKKNL